MATGPRDVAQPHQGDPAQATGLDQLLATGTHRVAVDAPRLDFGAATPFKGLVDAEHRRALAAVQVLEQQRQQDAGRRTGRPHRPVEHLMVAGVVPLVATSHDAQCCRHGALARGQDRTHQQHLGFPPGWVGKQRCEGNEYGYNDIGQGEHGWAFLWKVGSGQLTLSLYFSKLCVKSSEGRHPTLSGPNCLSEQGIHLPDVEGIAAGEVGRHINETPRYIQILQLLASPCSLHP